MNISYDWYKIFGCVAECGSITVAAEKLFISQPAVSQTIKQLEETLDCILFLRTPKGVRLTAEGKTLYKYISEGISAISEGEHRLTAMLRIDTGEIKIGASDMTLEFCLLPYLELFHQKYPNVKIAITSRYNPRTLRRKRRSCTGSDRQIQFGALARPPQLGHRKMSASRRGNRPRGD